MIGQWGGVVSEILGKLGIVIGWHLTSNMILRIHFDFDFGGSLLQEAEGSSCPEPPTSKGGVTSIPSSIHTYPFPATVTSVLHTRQQRGLEIEALVLTGL